MNAAQHHNQLPGEDTQGHAKGLALSALADGEIGASDLGALLASPETSAETLSNWHAYQVIGDVLRGHDDPTSSMPTNDFLAAVRIGLRTQDIETVAANLQPVGAVAVRAAKDHVEAANDGVFQWKLVAGFASLAAVMAVSWSVLIGPAGAPGGMADSQWVLTSTGSGLTPPPQNTTAGTSVASSTVSPVEVNTGQGVLIRDAQLEALLAEHRQHGGMSALQMPSGFIRNATYDAAGR